MADRPFVAVPRPLRRPRGLGYTRWRLSRVHSPYALTHRTRPRWTLSSGTTRIGGDRPVPHIVTELPGPKARAHVAFDETWTSPSLPRAYPIVPVRGEGLTVEDIDGNLFLDFAAGIAVTSTGHSHPQVVAAIKEQAGELIHFSASDFYLPDLRRGLPRARPDRPDRRAARGPTSATRARRSSRRRSSSPASRPAPVRRRVPGRASTAGRMARSSLTASKAKYHAGFGPLLPGVFHAPYGRVEDLRWFDEVLFDKLAPADEVAAIIVEPIQGEGGYIVPEDGFLAGPARDLRQARHPAHRRRDPVGRRADRQDVGDRALGRRAGHPADGQGHRLGHAARGARRPGRAARGAGDAGAHGSTYGGNPVACAAALATIDLLEGGLVENAARARRAGTRRSAPARRSAIDGLVRDVRGLGLMLGVEFDTAEHAEEVQWACFERGLLVLECGKSTRPDVAGADRHARPRWRPRCGSSPRPSRAVAGHGAAVLDEVVAADALHEVEAAG